MIQRIGSDSRLSRCLINGSTATYQDHMTLKTLVMDRLWNGLNIILKHISGLHVKQMKRINLNGNSNWKNTI